MTKPQIRAASATREQITAMQSNTVLLDLTFHKFGTKKATTLDNVVLKSGDGEAQMTDNAWALSKRLIDSDAVRAINTHFRKTRDAVLLRSVPSFDREGVYRVSIAAIEQVEQILMDAADAVPALRESFALDYDNQKAAMRAEQGDKFNERDYPPADEAAARYGLDWEWLAIGVPGALAAVDSALHARAMAAAQKKTAEVVESVEQVLRAGLLACVDKMRDDLGKTTSTGRPRAYRAAAMQKVTTFLQTFPLRNFVNDGVASDALKQMVAIVQNIPGVDALDDHRLRGDVITALANIADELRPHVTDAAARAIALPDED